MRGGIRKLYAVKGVRLTPVLAFRSDEVVGEHGTSVHRTIEATGPIAACCAAARASLREYRRGRLVVQHVWVRESDGEWSEVDRAQYPGEVGWDEHRGVFTAEP